MDVCGAGCRKRNIPTGSALIHKPAPQLHQSAFPQEFEGNTAQARAVYASISSPNDSDLEILRKFAETDPGPHKFAQPGFAIAALRQNRVQLTHFVDGRGPAERRENSVKIYSSLAPDASSLARRLFSPLRRSM
jgi:hypothetical protein